MFTYWMRPAVAALFWILLAALTLSELATLPPSLHAASSAYSRRPALRAARARNP